MTNGVVQNWRLDRAFGFIRPDDGGRDVYCHISEVKKAGANNLYIGQRVSFDIVPDRFDPGKTRAVNLNLAA
jgi:CspA family cold shock protein